MNIIRLAHEDGTQVHVLLPAPMWRVAAVLEALGALGFVLPEWTPETKTITIEAAVE